MTISKIRVFNGKKYRLIDQTFTKSDALKSARSFRKDGNMARIIETSKGYAVYGR